MDEPGIYTLDTNHLPEGIYLYELVTGQSVVTGKLVKSDVAAGVLK
jgi:hypothetical protein